MRRRALLVALVGIAAVLVAVSSARANGNFYVVNPGAPDGAGSCAPYPNVPGGFTCTTLRAAVTAANADAGADDILLQPGAYSLAGALPLTTDVDIFSGNARTATIQGTGADRLFTIAPGITVTLYGLTLSGGNAPDAEGGGAVDNHGTLTLAESRVTGNQAVNGGGIANQSAGTLDVEFSLVDSNQASSDGGQGGGIVNHGSLSVDNSTIALNTAGQVGGIFSDADTFTTLNHATVAGNDSPGIQPGGVSFLTGTWTSTGSLFIHNTGDGAVSNCNTPQSNGTDNLADDQTCGFGAGNGTQGLPTTIGLSDKGGMTDVVDVTGTPAAGTEASCPSSPYDQRLGQRQTSGPCDYGAYEHEVAAGPITPLFPFPTPTPSATPPPTPTPVVTPTPTPTPTPVPVPGQSVVVTPVKGKVLVKKPGTNTFVEVNASEGIPLGSTVDATHGTIQLTSQQTSHGKLQTAIFYAGQFKITQTKATTDLTLNQPLAACGKGAHAAAAKKKPKTRSLWGSGHGAFRTVGQYSAATVRGTKWFVQDSCAGTLTRVAQGVVSVRDDVRHKTILLKAGKHYLARPRR